MKKRATLLFALIFTTSIPALAQEASKSECIFDYIRYCSVHRIGSDGLKQCLEKNGLNLSPGCLKALIDDKLITREYINAKAKEKGMIAKLTGQGIEFDRDMSALTKPTAPVVVNVPDKPAEVAVAPVVEKKPDVAVTPVEKKEEPAIVAPVEKKPDETVVVSPPVDAPTTSKADDKTPPVVPQTESSYTVEEKGKKEVVIDFDDVVEPLKPKNSSITKITKKTAEIKNEAETAYRNLAKKTKDFINRPRKSKVDSDFDPRAPKNPKNDYYKREAEKDPRGSWKFPQNAN